MLASTKADQAVGHRSDLAGLFELSKFVERVLVHQLPR